MNTTFSEVYRHLSPFHEAWVATKGNEEFELVRQTLMRERTEAQGDRVLAACDISFIDGVKSLKRFVNGKLKLDNMEKVPESDFPPLPDWIAEETLRKVVAIFQREFTTVCQFEIEREITSAKNWDIPRAKRPKITYPDCEPLDRDPAKPVSLEEASTALYLIPGLAALNYPESTYLNAFLLLKSGDLQAIPTLESLAKSGHTGATECLLKHYASNQEFELAGLYAKLGDEQGLMIATDYLAIFYEKGLGVKPDFVKAKTLLGKLYDAGILKSEVNIEELLKEKRKEAKAKFAKPNLAPLQKRDVNAP